MATNYTLQYRVKGTTAWITGPTGVTRDVNNEMLASVTGLTYNPATTYEFRWQRVVDGTTVGHSNAVEATLQDVSTITTFNGSATLNNSGTYSLAVGPNDTTIVRSTSKLVLQLTANWDYVKIDLNSPLNGNSGYYVNKTGSDALAGYVLNTAVIVKTSNKTVDVLLDKSYTYTITIKFAGASSGTILVNAY